MEPYEKYKVGESYNMTPVEIRTDSNGNDYIVLIDGDGDREYRVYTILKYQYEQLPRSIPVTVKELDIMGRIKLRMDVGKLFRDHYEVGKLYAFRVVDVSEDAKGHPFCTIEDDFSQHRYYLSGDKRYVLDDDCILEVAGFTNEGYLKFREVEHVKEVEKAHENVPQSEQMESPHAHWLNAPILEIGDEGTRLEFKTSIVFSPGSHEADIDNQLDNIIKTLCAFMNTEGGTLYIGIHDKTKRVVGFKEDYSHLNDGEDSYAGTYSENRDGYELKIRNTIDRKCNGFANSLIEFSFHDVEGAEYCQIEVKKAKRPVWFNGVQLWIRSGNRKVQLRGDEISLFITDMMTVTVRNMLDVEAAGRDINSLSKEELVQTIRTVLSERQRSDIPLPSPPDPDEIDYWINWYADGTWRRSREKGNDDGFVKHLAVPKNMNNPVVVFCYESGKVNTIKLSDFRRGANMNHLVTKSNRLWPTGENPMEILLASPSSLLVGWSVDEHGIEYVKFHEIGDYNPTQSSANTGSPFVPANHKMTAFRILDVAHKAKLARLQCTKQKRSTSAGTPLDSPTYQTEINYLNEIIK